MLIRSRREILAFGRCLALPVLLLFAQSSGSCAAGFEFRPVSLPKEFVGADCRIHPVNVIGDAACEIVVVQGQTVNIFVPEEGKLRLFQKILLPIPGRANGKTYYGFARLGNAGLYSIVILTPDGILYYPTEADHVLDAPKVLVKRQMIQGQSSGKPVQYFDFALDLNKDGLDELLVPEQNGFSILRQASPMRFETVPLPRNPFRQESIFRFHRELPEDPERVPAISGSITNRKGVDDLLFYDSNGDGLQDLVYSTTRPGPNSKEVERYDVFLQRKGLVFDSKPSQSLEVPYESNADVTFRDVNRDGRLDAVIVKSNFDIVNPKTVVKFYIAGPQQYQLFTRETVRFVTKDPIGLVRLADFNADGSVDFAMTYFSYQFGSVEDIVDFALASRLRFKLQFFLGERGGQGFARQPSAEKELVISMKAESYRGYPPVMVTDDLNGDKIMDLVVRSDEGTLDVYGSQGALTYPKDPDQSFSIPADAVVDYEDVNGDGLNDILVSSVLKQSFTIYVTSPKR